MKKAQNLIPPCRYNTYHVIHTFQEAELNPAFLPPLISFFHSRPYFCQAANLIFMGKIVLFEKID